MTEELVAGGIYATHAAALVYEGRTVVVVGRSGAGKTTLALALVRQGLGMLSDELALSAPDARTILPYRRGLHIRPGTPELIEQLSFVTERPFHPLSSGPQWTLRPDELEEVFPTCLAEPAPLGEIVLLERRGEDKQSVLEPVSSGIVAVELLQATTAAATDFDGALQRVGRLVDGTRCESATGEPREHSRHLDQLARRRALVIMDEVAAADSRRAHQPSRLSQHE